MHASARWLVATVVAVSTVSALSFQSAAADTGPSVSSAPPSAEMTDLPTDVPSELPTDLPSDLPTDLPGEPTYGPMPTDDPTSEPTEEPVDPEFPEYEDTPWQCSVVLPSRLVVDAPYERFTARLAADCASSGTDYAAWDLYHSRYGWNGILIFDSGESSDGWDFYDWESLGAYTVRPAGAWDYDYNDLPQNTRTTLVRAGSRLALSGKRAGKVVTLRSTVTRYTPSASRFRPWAKVPVRLYSKTCTKCSWKYFKTVRTNSAGKITARFTQRNTRYYQARTLDTGTTWGRTATTRR